jgi:predicted transcriptional regulator
MGSRDAEVRAMHLYELTDAISKTMSTATRADAIAQKAAEAGHLDASVADEIRTLAAYIEATATVLRERVKAQTPPVEPAKLLTE